MEYTVSLIIGYLIGSVPFAFLILKKSRGIDITKEGSGNVGAMNSYEVTRSRSLGIFILVLDAAKGAAGAFIPMLIYPEEFTLSALSLLGAVFSHCYNPWLQFKGGRGLATAAGGAIVISPIILFAWTLIWVIVYYMRHDIHIGNILASALSLLVFLNISPISYKYTYPMAQSVSEYVLFITALLMIILSRHTEPLREILKDSKFLYRKRK